MNAPHELPEVLRDARQTPDAEAAAQPSTRKISLVSRQRLLIAAIAVLVLIGLFYPVENVVVASGQVIPSDRVQSVQHLEGGIVTLVHVKEGQIIRKGDPILEIDLGGTSPGKKGCRAALDCTGNGRSGRVFKNDYPTLFFSLAAGACAADTETHIFFDLD